MYCSSCGSSVPPGLSYCNRCGADLRPKEDEAPKRFGPAPNFLVAGMVFVTIFGLIAVMMLMGVMSQMLRASDGVINGFAAVAFFLILLVDALFAFLLLRSKIPITRLERWKLCRVRNKCSDGQHQSSTFLILEFSVIISHP